MLDSLRFKSLDAHDALFDVRVDQCRHQIWTNWTPAAVGGPKVFTRHLLVDLTVRFDNGDAVPLVVNGVRLALFRGRRIWMPRHLANSHMAIAYVANGSQPIELTTGLSVPPESVSQPYTFAMYADLPREASSLDETHFGVVSFTVDGHPAAQVTVPLADAHATTGEPVGMGAM